MQDRLEEGESGVGPVRRLLEIFIPGMIRARASMVPVVLELGEHI